MVQTAKLETMVHTALEDLKESKDLLTQTAEEIAALLLEDDSDIEEHCKSMHPVTRIVLVRACVARWQKENRK